MCYYCIYEKHTAFFFSFVSFTFYFLPAAFASCPTINNFSFTPSKPVVGKAFTARVYANAATRVDYTVRDPGGRIVANYALGHDCAGTICTASYTPVVSGIFTVTFNAWSGVCPSNVLSGRVPVSPAASPSVSPSVSPAQAVGDVNRDGKVDILDYEILIHCYGQSPTGSCATSDLNNDGVIDGIDYNIFIRAYFASLTQ